MITQEDAAAVQDFLRKKNRLLRIGDAMPFERHVIYISLEAVDRMIPKRTHKDREGNHICPVCKCPVLDYDKFCPDCGQSIRHELF